MSDHNTHEHKCINCIHIEVCAYVDPLLPSCDSYEEPRPTGYWIRQDDTYTRFQCSHCKSKNHPGGENFCPACGADMRKKKKKENANGNPTGNEKSLEG